MRHYEKSFWCLVGIEACGNRGCYPSNFRNW